MREFMKSIIERILRCRCLDKSELSAFINHYIRVGYERGYAQCKKDYGIENELEKAVLNRSVSKVKSKTDKVMLFIKADRGSNVIDDIRREQRLSKHMTEALYEVTQKLWVGDKCSFDENLSLQNLFNVKGEKSEFGPEYDSIAILINLATPIFAQLSDSFERHEFIARICSSSNECDAISPRLPMHRIEDIELIDM